MARKQKKSVRPTSVPKLQKTGLSPGTLIYTGTRKMDKPVITVMAYDENSFSENKYPGVELIPGPDENKITWINVDGLHEAGIIEKLGIKFGIHLLVLEDILNVYQLPKLDEYPENNLIFITLNEFTITENRTLSRDQISIVFGKNFVLTFQEEEGDYFNMVRERIRSKSGRIRKRGTDYLVYALIDSVVDSYYVVLDNFTMQVEKFESDIFENESKNQIGAIHQLNKDLITLKRSVAPLTEVIYHMMKEDTILISGSMRIFLRDLQDHMNQIVNQIEADRDFLSDLINTNMTNLNSRLNETMKVLTVISTIFIPLTFIVGVYGMNFDFLPELHWRYGYFIVWGVMLAIVIFQVIIFKKNKWL